MRFPLGLLPVVAVAALATTACGGTTYAFVPATNATASLYGHPAVDYPIPPQSPHGTLRVASYGIEPLASPDDDPDDATAALHVRLFVSNQSDQPWTVDTREQQTALEGHATSTPAFASASPGATMPPVVTIAPHGTRLVDVFFPLPESMQSASSVPSFQFTATVHTDAGAVSQGTPFARVATDGDAAYADDSAPQVVYSPEVYGYDYWDSPFYYNPTFVGFYGGVYPRGYWGRPYYARGRGWGGPGYYHGWHGPYRGGPAYRGGVHGGYRGGVGVGHGGGGHGGHR